MRWFHYHHATTMLIFTLFSLDDITLIFNITTIITYAMTLHTYSLHAFLPFSRHILHWAYERHIQRHWAFSSSLFIFHFLSRPLLFSFILYICLLILLVTYYLLIAFSFLLLINIWHWWHYHCHIVELMTLSLHIFAIAITGTYIIIHIGSRAWPQPLYALYLMTHAIELSFLLFITLSAFHAYLLFTYICFAITYAEEEWAQWYRHFWDMSSSSSSSSILAFPARHILLWAPYAISHYSAFITGKRHITPLLLLHYRHYCYCRRARQLFQRAVLKVFISDIIGVYFIIAFERRLLHILYIFKRWYRRHYDIFFIFAFLSLLLFFSAIRHFHYIHYYL